MKHLLAAATVAALLAAAPASAQTAYGSVVVPNSGDVGAETTFSGDWKSNFQIYGSAMPTAEAQNNATAGAVPFLVEADPGLLLNGTNFDGAVFNAQGSGTTIDAVAVPEPTTWAMMLIGFGAIGVALRGRRKATVSYA